MDSSQNNFNINNQELNVILTNICNNNYREISTLTDILNNINNYNSDLSEKLMHLSSLINDNNITNSQRINNERLYNLFTNIYEENLNQINSIMNIINSCNNSNNLIRNWIINNISPNLVNNNNNNIGRNYNSSYRYNYSNIRNSNIRNNRINQYSRENNIEMQNLRQNSQLINNFLQRFFQPINVYPTQRQILNATRIVKYCDIVNPINTSCPISMTDFNDNDNVTIIRYCGHIFNSNEINIWFSRSCICPVCRYDIRNYSQQTNNNEGKDDGKEDYNENNNNRTNNNDNNERKYDGEEDGKEDYNERNNENINNTNNNTNTTRNNSSSQDFLNNFNRIMNFMDNIDDNQYYNLNNSIEDLFNIFYNNDSSNNNIEIQNPNYNIRYRTYYTNF